MEPGDSAVLGFRESVETRCMRFCPVERSQVCNHFFRDRVREEYEEFRSSGVQEFRSSGVQEFRSSGVQEFRSSGVQEFRSSGVQGGTSHKITIKKTCHLNFRLPQSWLVAPELLFLLTLWGLSGRWPANCLDENLPRRCVGSVNFDRWLLPRWKPSQEWHRTPRQSVSS